jgi:hypothetical protein
LALTGVILSTANSISFQQPRYRNSRCSVNYFGSDVLHGHAMPSAWRAAAWRAAARDARSVPEVDER